MGTNLPCPDCGKDIYFCGCTVETRTLRRRIKELEEEILNRRDSFKTISWEWQREKELKYQAEERIKELEEKNERHHRIAEKFIELNRKSKVQLAKAEEILKKYSTVETFGRAAAQNYFKDKGGVI